MSYTPTPWHDGSKHYRVTGPTSPSVSGVTVQESVAHRRWSEEWDRLRASGTQPEQLPKCPAKISVPITVGMKTVAIATGETREEAEANAGFIVRCVNSHDALVAALKEAQRYFRNRTGNEEIQLCEIVGSALHEAGDEL